jgi:type VI secretion system secreted protein VgrG
MSASRLVTVLGASLLIVGPSILEKPLKIGRAFPHVSVAGSKYRGLLYLDFQTEANMPTVYTQENRQISLATPLGKDVFLLTGFQGKEEMSRPFEFQLDALSLKQDITAKDIVGKNVTWILKRGLDEPRTFNGIVSRFSAGALQGRDMRHYHLEVVPWLWLLTRTTDCRIFQKKSVPDIIKQIFTDLGQTDFKVNLTGSYTTRDYCVQYRESDFHFVSRLMEEVGIFYWIEHEEGKHTLVLADRKSAYKPCLEKTAFYAPSAHTANKITRWEHKYELRPGKYAQTDYNFEKPTAAMMAKTDSLVKLGGNDKLEIYDYPGVYDKKADGEALAKIRIEAEETAHDVVSGDSTCRTFAAGAKFTLDSHECPTETGQGFLLTSVSHAVTEPTYTSGAVEGLSYRNTFTCIPDSVVFRPARSTPRPCVQGVQTAVVVGPGGEEIYTDKFGRIKVQFHWDREGKKDENSSCWMRVATTWAGKGWGFQQIPRIGQEVIIDFLEGNPDRPIVTGSVYNADHMPSAKLPEERATSGMKSASYPGSAGWNGLHITDTKQKELVAIHAQKDMTTTVEHDDTLTVKTGDRTIAVEAGKHTETIKGDTAITIESGKYSHTVAANTASYYVNADQNEKYDANQLISVTQKQGTEAGEEITVTSKGAFILLKAATEIQLVVGGSNLSMKSDGTIQLIGKDILVKGSATVTADSAKATVTGGQEAKLGVGGQAVVCNPGKVAISGAAISSSAAGMHEVTGAVVKIN